MGTLKLNNVTAITESGGTVSLNSATVVPAAGVTGVLPSAVTDNITTLGTVTAGSIGSAVAFPAGHVIQSTGLTKALTTTTMTIGGGNTSWTSSVVYGEITPQFSNSAIIMHANFFSHISDDSGDSGMTLRIKRTGTGITDNYPDGMEIQQGADSHMIDYWGGGGHWSRSNMMSFSLQDENVSVASTTVRYTLEGSGYNIGSYWKLGSNTWTQLQWSVWLQEIKR